MLQATSLLKNILFKGDILVMPLELSHYDNTSLWNNTTWPAYLTWGKYLFDVNPTCNDYLDYSFSFIWSWKFLTSIKHDLIPNDRRLYCSLDTPTLLKEFHKELENHSKYNSYSQSYVYSFRNMNKYGDIIQTNSLESFPSKQIPTTVNDCFLKAYHELERFVTSKGAHIVLTWPVLNETDSDQDLIRLYLNLKHKGITIIGTPNDMKFPLHAFSDSHYHLKKEYADDRTERLLNVLKSLKVY